MPGHQPQLTGTNPPFRGVQLLQKHAATQHALKEESMRVTASALAFAVMNKREDLHLPDGGLIAVKTVMDQKTLYSWTKLGPHNFR